MRSAQRPRSTGQRQRRKYRTAGLQRRKESVATLSRIAARLLRDAYASPLRSLNHIDDFAAPCQAATAHKVNFERENPACRGLAPRIQRVRPEPVWRVGHSRRHSLRAIRRPLRRRPSVWRAPRRSRFVDTGMPQSIRLIHRYKTVPLGLYYAEAL